MTKDEALRSRVKPSEVTISSGSKFFGAVFLYVCLALAITAVTNIVASVLLNSFINSGNEDALITYGKLFIAAIVLYIPALLWARISIARNGKTMVPAYVTYSICIGLLVSPLVSVCDFYTVAVSFGVTCLAFGVMSLIAMKSKRNLSTLGILASGLFFGALMMMLVNVIISLFAPGFTILDWAISFVILIATVLVSMFDIRVVKELASNGATERNVALCCALNLYVDFIYIFIRVLMVVARNRNR